MNFFKPTLLGTALIKAYEHIGIELYKPYLRAGMERDMKDVCEGKLQTTSTFDSMKHSMKQIFKRVFMNTSKMKTFLIKFLNENNDFEQQLNIRMKEAKEEAKNINQNSNYNNKKEENKVDENDDVNFDDDSNINKRGRGGRRGRGSGNSRGNNRGGRGGSSNIGGRQKKKQNDNYAVSDDEEEKLDNKKIKKNKTVNNKENSHLEGFKDAKSTKTISNNKELNDDIISNKFKKFTNNNINKCNNEKLPINDESCVQCPKCKVKFMRPIKSKKGTYFLSCSGFPDCRNILNINDPISLNISNETCSVCRLNKLYEVEYGDAEPELICLGNCIINNSSAKRKNNYNFNDDYSANTSNVNNDYNTNKINNNFKAQNAYKQNNKHFSNFNNQTDKTESTNDFDDFSYDLDMFQ